MKASSFKSKRAAVEAGLRKLVAPSRYQRVLELYGKVDWQGDLAAMRGNRRRRNVQSPRS